EDGSIYWSARELAKILGYTEYGKFSNAIKKAEEACKNSGQAVSDHFAHVSDMIGIGKGAKRKVSDVHLSRYACYLLIQNSEWSGKDLLPPLTILVWCLRRPVLARLDARQCQEEGGAHAFA
ncbi:MAG TPA: BRO family protein, partial [Ktedonobacteraceae bacterium]|nr:BRO family protein [Ktedonobacteraceae bacterium]